MKSNRIFPKIMTYPPMIRALSSAKRRKALLLIYNYGTSSKPATGNLPEKMSTFNTFKSVSVTVLPLVWKSATILSSVLNNITSQFRNPNLNASETQNEDSRLRTPGTEESKQTPTVTTKQELNFDGENLSKDHKVVVELEEIAPPVKKSENHDPEQSFFEWLAGRDLQAKQEFLDNDEKKVEKSTKPLISKTSLKQRSRFLVSSLTDASSSGSRLLRLEEVCKHLLLHPEQKSIMCQAGLVRIALRLKFDASDPAIQAQARCALSLLGYHNPPRGEGIRILSIDGGGTRGIMAIEVLRQLEAMTNRKVYELFDFFCGVSSGAILSLLLGGLRMSLDDVETLYRKLSLEIFNQGTFWGTSRLMWSHAYYDTSAWLSILKKSFGETLLIDTAKDDISPKIAVVSAIMNLPSLEAFVFRNYDFPPRVQSYYKGRCKYRMWESIRASGAAPGYFEEYCLEDYLHQDGGIMINNPTALSIHEARLLWPSDPIQCVLSLGCGRYSPARAPNFTSTSLKTKMLKVIDSATDTEAVHIAMNDLLTPDTYFRINPYLTEFLTLDENREEKLDQLKRDAEMYLRRNEYKFSRAAQSLMIQRNILRQTKDWLRVQKDMLW